MNSIISRRKATAFTLIEIMIVVLIIGILLAIAIPNFVSARETSRAKACVANLKQIDSATQQWAMDNKATDATYDSADGASTSFITTSLVGSTSYIRTVPTCPSGGAYSSAASLSTEPTCSIVTTNASNTDYQSGGKYYHGL
jgi:prepilin-type N-terminal cleavage/methylation domain-containing protein